MRLRAYGSIGLIVACFVAVGCSAPLTPTLAPSTPSPAVIKTCTLIGCSYALIVELKGKIPDDYVMEVTPGEDKTVSVHCVNGSVVTETRYPTMPYCTSSGVSFLYFQPDVLTVTVAWDNHTLSRTFHPSYPIAYPNGPECEPACPGGTIEFVIPDSP